MRPITCHICGSLSDFLFTTQVLQHYEVKYYRCSACGFIQTEKPYWLAEAYQSAITDLDVGLVQRNIDYAEVIYQLITSCLDYQGIFLDYAGGYGLFVRLMRDKGLDFYHHDKYCENLFARNFGFKDLPGNKPLEAVTALEVFEHWEKPVVEIENLLHLVDTIIFSTELIPDQPIKNPTDWWYFVPETGQHLSFYSMRTFETLAQKLRLHFYTNEKNIHILSKRSIMPKPFPLRDVHHTLPSLVPADFDLAKDYLQTQGSLNSATHHPVKIDHTLDKITQLHQQLDEIKEKFNIAVSENRYVKSQLELTLSERNQFESRLREIYASLGWRVLRRYYSIRDRLLPAQSSLRQLLQCLVYRSRLPSALHPRTTTHHRQVNRNSKKLVYVGHSYHAKTNSTRFLINYLKKYFQVTEILDESWQGKPYPDLSFIDGSYLGVVFFQKLPELQIFRQLKNQNVICFPMYDEFGAAPESYWEQYRGVKFINFSKTLHQKLLAWHHHSTYLQYFPKPSVSPVPVKSPTAFFWQRIEPVNVNLISHLLAKSPCTLHLHTATDPNQKFIRPTPSQEKKYHITYSDWFKSRAEMHAVLRQCNLYFAPRLAEGIGQSFLEAMAMGLAVVAIDNPTMNEYIAHNRTGYLYNMTNPDPLDLSNLEQIRQNTLSYMQAGHKQWLQQKSMIIDIIKGKR